MITSIQNARGMSLVEVMVVAGIVAFISLVVATTFSDIFRLQSQVVARDELNDFGAALGRFLFTESTCTAALAGTGYPNGTTKSPINLTGYQGFSTSPSVSGLDLGAGVIVTPKVRIQSLTLEDKLMPPQLIQANGANLQRYLGRIEVVLETLVDRTSAGEEWRASPPRTYELPLLVDPVSRQIRGCYLEMKVSDACQVLGTALDVATGRCVPMTQCIFEGHYSTNTCNPTGFGCPAGAINELTGGQSCPSGVATARETGVYDWSYVVACGKKCSTTIMVQTRYFVCLRCTP